MSENWMGTVTTQQVKSSKNPPETIIDKTPKEPYTSPLQKFIAQNCEQCTWYKAKCRLDDQNGIARMNLCIQLYLYYPYFFKDPTETIAEIKQKIEKEMLHHG
jgi:hypothetical protein